jgi:hypothetical protein
MNNGNETMKDLDIKLPESLESEKPRIKKRIGELIVFEEKRKKLLNFIDEIMNDAKNLDDEELVKLGRKLKKDRFKKLNI